MLEEKLYMNIKGIKIRLGAEHLAYPNYLWFHKSDM